jgi:hypothetical protein
MVRQRVFKTIRLKQTSQPESLQAPNQINGDNLNSVKMCSQQAFQEQKEGISESQN